MCCRLRKDACQNLRWSRLRLLRLSFITNIQSLLWSRQSLCLRKFTWRRTTCSIWVIRQLSRCRPLLPQMEPVRVAALARDRVAEWAWGTDLVWVRAAVAVLAEAYSRLAEVFPLLRR